MKLIQMGDSTHSQGQLTTPVSFSTMNVMVRRPTKPMPPDEDELLDADALLDV